MQELQEYLFEEDFPEGKQGQRFILLVLDADVRQKQSAIFRPLLLVSRDNQTQEGELLIADASIIVSVSPRIAGEALAGTLAEAT